jgi:hypothetical protein
VFDSSAVAEPLLRELARLRADGRDRSVAELVALVEQCQSLANQATALQVLAMAHLAAIEDVLLEDGTVLEQHRGLGHRRLDAPALVSDHLGLSDAAASSRLGSAVDVVTRVPAVHDAMASGRLDGYRAGIVCEELRDASPEVCREVGARIEGALGKEPPAALRRRVRQVLGAVDGDLLRARAATARSARSLRRWPGEEPGVDTWLGSFPVEQARSGWAVIDGLARQYVRDGRASRVDEARADALMDLIHSRATGTFTVQLAVPADLLSSDATSSPSQPRSSAPGSSGGPAPRASAVACDSPSGSAVSAGVDTDALVTVAGFGVAGETVVRRTWLEPLAKVSEAAGAPVVSCHPDTGALVEASGGTAPRSGRVRAIETTAYRPPNGLVELVKARDGRCRFPGCTVSAVFCDLDHVRPWPCGPTDPSNLICLCRRHHRIKQTVRWRVAIERDATVTWTDPTGRLRITLPLDYLQLAGTEQVRADPKAPQASQNPSRPSQPGRSDSPGVQPPRDEADVLWSAWEDELAHHLAREVSDRRRRPRPTLRLTRPFRHRPMVHGPGAEEPPPF